MRWIAAFAIPIACAAGFEPHPAKEAPVVASASASTPPSVESHILPPYTHAHPPAFVASLGGAPFRTDNDVRGLALSPDGALLAAGGREQVWVWDTATGKELHHLPDGYEPAKIVFGDGHRLLATMSDNHARVRVVELTTHKLLFDITRKTLSYPSFALSADGKRLAWEETGVVHVVSVDTGVSETSVIVPDSNFGDVELSPDGRVLYVARASSLQAWELASNKALWKIPCSPVPTLAIDRAGAVLALGGDSPARLIKTSDGAVLQSLPMPTQFAARSVAFSPDGKRVGVTGEGDTAKVFDVATGAVIGTILAEENVGVLAPSNDAAFTMRRSSPRRWQGGTPRMTEVMSDDHVGHVRSLAVTPDGKTLASSGDDGRLVVWDVANRTGKLAVHVPTGLMRAVAISRDGRFVAGGGRYHDVLGKTGEFAFLEVFDLTTNKRAFGVTGSARTTITALGFSDDGKQLVAMDDESTRAYAVPGGNELWKRKHPPLVFHHGFIFGATSLVAFNANPGSTLSRIDTKSGVAAWTIDRSGWGASIGGDRAAYGDGTYCSILDLATGKKLVDAMASGSGGVGPIALSADGKRCLFAYDRVNLFDNGNVRELAKDFGGRAEAVVWAGALAVVGGTMGIDLYDPSRLSSGP